MSRGWPTRQRRRGGEFEDRNEQILDDFLKLRTQCGSSLVAILRLSDKYKLKPSTLSQLVCKQNKKRKIKAEYEVLNCTLH
jgi:hypothetical protein